MSLRESWLSYLELLPPDASKLHIQEVKRAFFAGAYMTLSMLDADPGELLREAITFAEQVSDGKE